MPLKKLPEKISQPIPGNNFGVQLLLYLVAGTIHVLSITAEWNKSLMNGELL